MAPTNLDNSISWDALIDFAKSKKEEERRTGRPAELSQDQLSSILKLISAPEPQLEEDNWVSKLNEFCQKKNLTIDWSGAKPSTITLHGVDQPAWNWHIALPAANKKFPCAGYGYGPDGRAPAFSSKMKAKQFAALQAWRFIQNAPPDHSSRDERPASSRGDEGVSLVTPPSPPPPPPPLPPKRVKVEREQDAPTASFQNAKARALELARKLKYGEWTMNIESEDVEGNTWRGRAIFENDGRVPDDVGAVEGVVGRQNVEGHVTDKVLAWLEKEMQIAQERAVRFRSV